MSVFEGSDECENDVMSLVDVSLSSACPPVVATEDLVQVVQQLTAAEQSHCATVASLSNQLGQLKANQAAIVSRHSVHVGCEWDWHVR